MLARTAKSVQVTQSRPSTHDESLSSHNKSVPPTSVLHALHSGVDKWCSSAIRIQVNDVDAITAAPVVIHKSTGNGEQNAYGKSDSVVLTMHHPH